MSGSPQLFAQDILELDAARCAGDQVDGALALQSAQMLFGRIGRFEARVRAISARVGGMPLSAMVS